MVMEHIDSIDLQHSEYYLCKVDTNYHQSGFVIACAYQMSERNLLALGLVIEEQNFKRLPNSDVKGILKLSKL